jgi:uncharacterized protein (DUF983 family)
MSLCPYCQSRDKEFFADKCHNCNTEVSFGEQVAGSAIYTAVTVVGWVAVILLFFKFFG